MKTKYWILSCIAVVILLTAVIMYNSASDNSFDSEAWQEEHKEALADDDIVFECLEECGFGELMKEYLECASDCWWLEDVEFNTCLEACEEPFEDDIDDILENDNSPYLIKFRECIEKY